MAKEQEQPTLQKEIAGLLKEKEFVLHGIEITESTEFFNTLNEEIFNSLTAKVRESKFEDEQDRKDFIEMMRQHFHEIKLLRELYDNLKK